MSPEARKALAEALLTTPTTLVDVIRAIKRARKWDSRDLANEIGASYWSVIDWSRGRCLPTPRALPLLAEVSRGTAAEVSLQTLVWLWWKDQAEAEDMREAAKRRRARRAA